MIILRVPADETKAAEVEERLQSLSLAFRKEESQKVEVLTLEDGESVVEGHRAIQTYLDKLQGELHQWYYCNC